MHARTPKLLEDIRDAAAFIGAVTQGRALAQYSADRLLRQGVERNFEIIGEASNNIETHHPDFAAAHPDLPLSFAYQMRNAIAHGYFKVDYEIVWRTIHRDLPRLYCQVRRLTDQRLIGDDGHAP